MEVNILEKLPLKFHEYWTLGSLSRPLLSSKSLPGVLEDMEVPDTHGDGLYEIFMKIGHQEACHDPPYTPSLFLESWKTWKFLMHLVMVSNGRKHSREASLKVS